MATLHFAHTRPVVYQLLHVWPYAFGVPLAVLCSGRWSGAVALLRGTAGSLWPVVLGALLVTGAGGALGEDHQLPVTGLLLCVLAGSMIAAGTGALRDSGPQGVSLAAGLVVAALARLDCGLPGDLPHAGQPPRSHSVALRSCQARRGGSGRAMTPGAPISLPPSRMGASTGSSAMSHWPSCKDRPTAGTRMMSVKQAYLQSRLSEADWLVLTDTNLSRMATLKQQFPVINDFYEGLGQKRTPFTQAASFAAGPSLLGFALEDSGAELSFRMADHPTVHLYRRTTPAPQTMPAARHKKAEPRR